MQKRKRWTAILEICRTRGTVSVNELVEELHTSPATIRRDLMELEDMNLVRRYHGGAKAVVSAEEPGMFYKSEANTQAKRQIGLLAARMIKGNQLIYIDAGSTTMAMIPFINAKNITVVTSSISNLPLLGQKEIPTIVIGGMLRWSTQAVAGSMATESLSQYHFDLSFVGTNAVHDTVGFTTTNEEEAATKSLAIRNSKQAFILADSTKFNKLNPIRFARLEDAVVLADDIPNFDRSKLRYILTNGETNTSHLSSKAD
jgi:DeoR family fructose operon transcriptional repressor